MAGFKEIRLPIAISLGAVGGVVFDTDVVQTASGKEIRNINWSIPGGEWEVSYDARIQEVFEELQSFIYVVWGRGYGFRFRDWNNYQVNESNGLLLPVNGSATLFQLYKKFSFGGEVFYLRIQKPCLADPITGEEFTALYKDDVQLTYGPGGSQVVFDESMGLVAFNTAPGESVLHWVGDFDFPVRLDTDKMKGQTVNKNGRFLIQGWTNIPIVALKNL